MSICLTSPASTWSSVHEMAKWMQHARESMEKRGTVGSFGKYSASKVKRGLAEGGKAAKKAAFAKAAHTIAERHKHGG